MSKKIKIIIIAVVALFGIAVVPTFGDNLGSAPSGVQSEIATSSTITVGPQAVTTIFTAKTCNARVISTVTQPIMLSFSSDITPTGIRGHLQAASTTIEYDSGIYGCGVVTAYGFASTTITKSEFR